MLPFHSDFSIEILIFINFSLCFRHDLFQKIVFYSIRNGIMFLSIYLIHTRFVRKKSSSLYKCVSKNSSTVSVFHFVIDNVSTTFSFSSNNLTIGSAPRKYLIIKLGNLAGRSLLMKAWICGYAPNLQVHTSKMALGKRFVVGATSSFSQHSSQCSLWTK